MTRQNGLRPWLFLGQITVADMPSRRSCCRPCPVRICLDAEDTDLDERLGQVEDAAAGAGFGAGAGAGVG